MIGAPPVASDPVEPAEIPGRSVARAVALGILATLLSITASGVILTYARHRVGPVFPPSGSETPHVTARTIGMLEQTLVNDASSAHRLDVDKRRELTLWGYTDATRTTAKIPIDRAIDLVARDPQLQ
jgi:hypothetical protein